MKHFELRVCNNDQDHHRIWGQGPRFGALGDPDVGPDCSRPTTLQKSQGLPLCFNQPMGLYGISGLYRVYIGIILGIT